MGFQRSSQNWTCRKSDLVRINDMASVMGAAGNGVELVPMNFSFAPNGPKGGPVFNFRSEGRDFSKERQVSDPALGFFRPARNTPRPNTTYAGGSALSGDRRAVARSTGQSPYELYNAHHLAGPDIEPYHDRQVVVLRPRDWAAWLYLTKPQDELLRPLPAGSLEVETVRTGRECVVPLGVLQQVSYRLVGRRCPLAGCYVVIAGRSGHRPDSKSIGALLNAIQMPDQRRSCHFRRIFSIALPLASSSISLSRYRSSFMSGAPMSSTRMPQTTPEIKERARFNRGA